MAVKIFNPTKKTIAIWWGHTPYFIGPGNTEEVPDVVANDCLKHKDYKELKVVTSPEPTIERPHFVEAEKPKPWDDENWDPATASVEELQQFASVYGLVWDEEDLDNNRATITDRLLEIME